MLTHLFLSFKSLSNKNLVTLLLQDDKQSKNDCNNIQSISISQCVLQNLGALHMKPMYVLSYFEFLIPNI